jgi:protein TonB
MRARTQKLSPSAAQAAAAEKVLAAQINPPLDAPLKVLRAPAPPYPRECVMANIEGTVLIKFLVEADGSVRRGSVVGAAPDQLAAVSLQTISQWRFEPPTRNGQPVVLPLEQTFVFRLSR